MKCKLVDVLPRGEDWTYELKLDGFRALAIKNGKKVALISRNQKDLSDRFPEVLESLRQIPLQKALIDGEIVAFNDAGLPSFEALQNVAQSQSPQRNLVYYAFDLLNYEGRDVTQLPLSQRRSLLEEILPPLKAVRLSVSTDARPDLLEKEVRAKNLEGLVAKKLSSTYESGLRTGSWVKYKNLNGQEFVIGGYTLPEGTRKYFGALLVGYYQRGKLWYASRVGTGFSSALLRGLYQRLQPLVVKECPFVNVPETKPGRWGQGLTRADLRSCVWVRPELVAQIHFTEWTQGGHLRHPSFKGLREDKAGREVIREAA